jgi:hypothetical protein
VLGKGSRERTRCVRGDEWRGNQSRRNRETAANDRSASPRAPHTPSQTAPMAAQQSGSGSGAMPTGPNLLQLDGTALHEIALAVNDAKSLCVRGAARIGQDGRGHPSIRHAACRAYMGSTHRGRWGRPSRPTPAHCHHLHRPHLHRPPQVPAAAHVLGAARRGHGGPFWVVPLLNWSHLVSLERGRPHPPRPHALAGHTQLAHQEAASIHGAAGLRQPGA